MSDITTKTMKTPHVKYISKGPGFMAMMTIQAGSVSDAKLFRMHDDQHGSIIQFDNYLDMLNGYRVLGALIEEIKNDDPGYSEQPEPTGEGSGAE